MKDLIKRSIVYLGISLGLFTCTGDEGAIGPSGLNSLINILSENAGVNCATGGKKIQAGLDKNANNVLDIDEILTTNYVCNGEDGKTSLTVVVTESKGANCISGGVKITSGVDSNKNGILEENEITTTAYVCNGIDGINSLTKVTNESVGSNCQFGGLKIDSGIDSNRNGILDTSEIASSVYVCNGIDGNNSLNTVTNEVVGSNCQFGGLKIDSGIDSNRNGILDTSEIASSAYVCNGIDGNNSLNTVTNEVVGSNCQFGGLKIDSGIDSNRNGILDDTEIGSTTYVCNGIDGFTTIVNITDEIIGSNCKNGGVKITSGIDLNRNGTLDVSEIDVTRFVCNGIDGIINEEIQIKLVGGIGSAANSLSSTPITVQGNSSFDIRNFVNVDSVVFVSDPYVGNNTNFALVELFNFTDNQVIANTLIRTNNLNEEKKQLKTVNIFDQLPKKQLILGIKLSSEVNGQFSASGLPYLFLYRSK